MIPLALVKHRTDLCISPLFSSLVNVVLAIGRHMNGWTLFHLFTSNNWLRWLHLTRIKIIALIDHRLNIVGPRPFSKGNLWEIWMYVCVDVCWMLDFRGAWQMWRPSWMPKWFGFIYSWLSRKARRWTPPRLWVSQMSNAFEMMYGHL